MNHPYYPAHFYATGDPMPQLVRVQGNHAWLPDTGKLVPVASLQGKLVRLVEEPTQLPVGIPATGASNAVVGEVGNG